LSKSPQKLLSDLSEIKKVSLQDLHSWLTLDHTSFTVLSVSTKHIQSTNRLSVTLSKNSARSFYLGKENRSKSPASPAFLSAYGLPQTQDDCLKDAQNCTYFQFFNSKEKKLYTRFKDKVEENFEGTAGTQPVLFLTLTFNTTQNNYQAFTTNWNPEDDCWKPIEQKNNWLKDWATNFDPQAEPLKILISKIPQEHASNFVLANRYLTKFLRQIRLKWKPSHWKRVVVAELQKPKHRPATWHFHLLSTPIVPYSHKCTLDKNFTSCWNCRAYISSLWTHGRVESRSPGVKTISNYLAKYLAKSFHLRTLYQEHGFQTHSKAYHFFKNLYDYEQRPALLIGSHKLDPTTGLPLPKNQTIFRHYNYETHQTSYIYRTNERLVGRVQKPYLNKKHFRLGTRSLNPLNLLSLATKHPKKELYQFKKPPKPTAPHDFQELLITRLLSLCNKAEFLNTPLEQDQVPKETQQCSNSIYQHFQTKPILRFTFAPENTAVVRTFIDNLDTYTQEYDMEESQDFNSYPIIHDQKHKTTKQLNGLCGCEIRARNQYLDNWAKNYFYPNSDIWRRAPM